MNPIRLHRWPLSGHSHRAQLMLSLLGLPYELVDCDLAAGAHRQPGYLAINPLGQVPAIEDCTTVLADSNAILVYLALRYGEPGGWLPTTPEGQAAVQRWLSLAAGWLASGPGMARIEVLFGWPRTPAAAALAQRLFTVMEAALAGQDWLAAPHPTIADVAMYTYTAHAPEGGVPLAPYPAIRGWLARVEALPGFVPMQGSPEAPPLEPAAAP